MFIQKQQIWKIIGKYSKGKFIWSINPLENIYKTGVYVLYIVRGKK